MLPSGGRAIIGKDRSSRRSTRNPLRRRNNSRAPPNRPADILLRHRPGAVVAGPAGIASVAEVGSNLPVGEDLDHMPVRKIDVLDCD
jgi:hypothetical protein